MTNDDTRSPQDEAVTLLRAQIEAAEISMRTVREVLTETLAMVRDGGMPDLRKIKDLQTELAKSLRQACEIERTYDEWRARFSGNRDDEDIDFDAVRDIVRSKLDGLSERLGSRGASDGPEGASDRGPSASV